MTASDEAHPRTVWAGLAACVLILSLFMVRGPQGGIDFVANVWAPARAL